MHESQTIVKDLNLCLPLKKPLVNSNSQSNHPRLYLDARIQNQGMCVVIFSINCLMRVSAMHDGFEL
jgi:hypothetical protein